MSEVPMYAGCMAAHPLSARVGPSPELERRHELRSCEERGRRVEVALKAAGRGDHSMAGQPGEDVDWIQGYLAHKKQPPPWDPKPRALWWS